MRIYLSILLLTMPFVAKADGGEGCYDMIGWYGGGWGMFLYPLFWILVIGAIVVFMARGFGREDNKPSQDKSKPAIDILKERYAKGEISKDKFEEMKKDIGK